MKYNQYCNRVKNILVAIVHQPCVCTPYVQESKKLWALIFNKDKHKLLARKNRNENTIWSWNDSGVVPSLSVRLACLVVCRTRALLWATSVMTSFIKGVAVVWEVNFYYTIDIVIYFHQPSECDNNPNIWDKTNLNFLFMTMPFPY